MIVYDASVLIAFLDRDDHLHLQSQRLLADTVDDDIAANSLTLAEVLVAPARAGRMSAAQQALTDLEVEELPFPPDTPSRLAQLRADTGLKLPDCCVLLAAESLGAGLASLDSRLVKAARNRDLPVVGPLR